MTALCSSGPPMASSAQAAIDKINAIANPQLPKIGERFLELWSRQPISALRVTAAGT